MAALPQGAPVATAVNAAQAPSDIPIQPSDVTFFCEHENDQILIQLTWNATQELFEGKFA
jgi:hypothetical protein